MKHLKHFLAGVLLLCTFLSQSQSQTLVNVKWQESFGHPVLNNQLITAAADYNNGIIYLLGNTYITGQQENFYITKLDAAGSGDVVWQRDYNSLSNLRDYGTDIVVKGSYLYVTGFSWDSAANKAHFITMKLLEANGDTVWTAAYSASYNGYNATADMAVDDNGNVYVAGTQQVGSTDYAITAVKYDSAGTKLWVGSYDSLGLYDGAVAIELTATKVNLTGFSGTGFSNWDFVTVQLNKTNGTLLDYTRSTNGNGNFSRPVGMVKDDEDRLIVAGTAPGASITTDIKIIAYDSLLNELWVSTWGDSLLNEEAVALVNDFGGGDYICGTQTKANGGKDMVLLKYKHNDGTLQWAQTIAAPNPQHEATAKAITADVNGNIYVTGRMRNGANIAIATASYSSDGDARWLNTYNRSPETNDDPDGIIVDSTGNLYVNATSRSGTDTVYMAIKYKQTEAFVPEATDTPSAAYAFYENKGQILVNDSTVADSVFYYTNAGSPQMYVGDKRLSYVIASADTAGLTDTLYRIDMQLSNTIRNNRENVFDDLKTQAHLNYFLGNLPQAVTYVKGYNRLMQKEVFRGIDWELYTGVSGFKTRFIVAPEENPALINFTYHGADTVTENNLAITLHTAIGNITIDTLVAYTVNNLGNRTWVSISYTQTGNKFEFALGGYNDTEWLVIEQERSSRMAQGGPDNLMWSTYFGGNSYDGCRDVDVDALGNLFVVTNTSSLDFPPTPGIIGSLTSSSNTVVSKFNSANQLLWSAYFGGTTSLVNSHQPRAIVVGDATDQPDQPLYVCGRAGFSDLPITQGSFPGSYNQSFQGGYNDMFLIRLNGTSGLINYVTYIGGSNYDEAYALLLNRQTNELFVGGLTESSNFPYTNTQTGNFYDDEGLGVIMQFDRNMNLIWATGFGSNTTYVPGDPDIKHGAAVQGLAFDTDKNLIVTGKSPFGFSYTLTQPLGAYTQNHLCTSALNVPYNAFLAKLTRTSVSANINKYNLYYYSEYGGTSPNEAWDVCTDANDNIYMVGQTEGAGSLGLVDPGGSAFYNNSMGGSLDGFITKFDGEGDLIWATLFGSAGSDWVSDVEVDDRGNIYCYGQSHGNGLSLVQKTDYYYDDLVPNTQAFGNKCYIASFDENYVEDWITYFGGKGGQSVGGIKVYNDNDLYISGTTASDQLSATDLENYPLRWAPTDWKDLTLGGSADGFLARLDINALTTSLGKEPQLTSPTFLIFPNPNGGQFKLVFDEVSEEPKKLRIFNLIGQLITQEDIHEQEMEINLPWLSNGIYHISVTSHQENLTKSFVIQHQ